MHVRRWRGSFTNASAWEWTWPTAGEMQRCAVSCNIPRRAGWGRRKQFLWKFHQPLLSRHGAPQKDIKLNENDCEDMRCHSDACHTVPIFSDFPFFSFFFIRNDTFYSFHAPNTRINLSRCSKAGELMIFVNSTFFQPTDTDLLGTWTN